MSIANDREYGLTRCKLDNVREMIASIERRPPAATSAARSASLRSLRAYENQLAEELVRYVTHSCPEVSVRTIASGAAPDVR